MSSRNKKTNTIVVTIKTTIKKIAIAIGNQNGDVTHHQDQSITLVNLSVIKIRNNTTGDNKIVLIQFFIPQR